MYNDVTEVVSQAGLTLDDVTYVLPHQANIRIVETGRKKLGLPPEKVLTNIEYARQIFRPPASPP